jgi:hypothetical protein
MTLSRRAPGRRASHSASQVSIASIAARPVFNALILGCSSLWRSRYWIDDVYVRVMGRVGEITGTYVC